MRSTGPPLWLKDYVCQKLPTTTPGTHYVTNPAPSPEPLPSDPSSSFLVHNSYPLFHPTDLAHLSPNFVFSLASVLQVPEPSCYAQAQQYPEWLKAMSLELTSLEHNGTWILTPLPPWEESPYL